MSSKIFCVCFLLLAHIALAADGSNPGKAHEESIVVYEVKTKTESSGGGGTSRSKSALIERVIGERDGGLEVEYSFPNSDNTIPKTVAWKLPARVQIGPNSTIALLNKPEIDKRLHMFLEENPEIKKLCGQTVFTWTAISIHCKSEHVVDVVKVHNLHLGDLFPGKQYMEPGAVEGVGLELESSTEAKLIYKAKMDLDPEYLKSAFEESYRQTASIVGKDIDSLISEAYELPSGQRPTFSGTVSVILEVLPNGTVTKIVRKYITETVGGDGFTEIQESDEIVERRSID